MHTLVTGASGFVGLHTVLALREAGHSVTLGVRNPDKMRALLERLGMPSLRIAVGEITDRAAMERALEGCDALVHTAALVSMDPCQAELMRRTNVEGTRVAIDCALQKGLESIVYVSSAAALFNPALPTIDDNTPLANPNSAYAQSKAEAEHYVWEQVRAGAKIAVTYPASVVGPDDPGISEANRTLQIILGYTHIHTSSGVQMIDVRDLARAQVRLLEGRYSGRYLVAGHYLPWRELGQRLEAVTGRRLRKLPVPGGALRSFGRLIDQVSRLYPVAVPLNLEAMNFATRWVPCDDSKLRLELGIDHRPIEETLGDTVRWLADAGHIPAHWMQDLRG